MSLDPFISQTMIDWIDADNSVLDLGCGDGALLAQLNGEKSVLGLGLEIDADNIQRCIEKGVNVLEHDLNLGLRRFDDDSFDTVVMTQTLQAIERPDQILEEMLRVGRHCIVMFPNFGHWQPRFYLMTKGRMPVSDYLPYTWYDTPNIHFFTVDDFKDLCEAQGYRVLNYATKGRTGRPFSNLLSRIWPNLFAQSAVFHLSRR